jgi:2-pyrone-4,6-dicarboxylate lactonase
MRQIKTCKGPDPATRAPAGRPLPGACDTHCHVFGPQHLFPYSADRAYTPPDAPLSELQRVHRTLGIDRAVIVQASCHGSDNSAILAAMAGAQDRYRGIAIVDGHETDRDYASLHDGGVRGIRFNFVRHLGGVPDLAFFDRTVDRLHELGWHVVLHLDAEDILTHRERLDALPVPFVIDHMGRVRAEAGLEQTPFVALLDLMRNPRAWIKICGPERISSTGAPFRDAIPFAQALYRTAPNRVLWGTDWPHPNIARDMPNDGDLVDLLHLALENHEARRAVLVDNPNRLYWLDLWRPQP